MGRPVRATWKPTFVLCLVSCQFNPFASEFTSVRPNEQQLVASYAPDRETRDRLASQLNITIHPQCRLELRRDHTFTATNLPDCWFSNEIDCAPGLVTFSGEWTVSENQEWWAVDLRARSINGVARDFQLPAMVRGDRPPYILHLTIGDPDSGNAVAFERIVGEGGLTSSLNRNTDVRR